MKRIYLSPPHLGNMEFEFVQEAFRSNWISTVGPHIEAFEAEIARYAGTKGAIVVSSGTAGLHLALRVHGVGPGDTVFVSTLTFIASVNPIIYQGAEPVFIDSEPDSWNMSPAALERALADAARKNRLPKAVIAVNLYGQSAKYDEIKALCAPYGIPVIEDAAESLGAEYKGRRSGSIGDIGVYSFNGNKIITTSGGGAVVSDNLEHLQIMKHWSTQARMPEIHYQHEEIGYNYRMSNILAGIGRGQLLELDGRVAARRKVFANYRERLGAIEGISFMPELAEGFSTRWLTAMTVDPSQCPVPVSRIIAALQENEIESRPVWKPMHLQPCFAGKEIYAHSPELNVAEQLFACGICLPSGSNLTEEEQSRVMDIIEEVIHKQSVSL
ncbi:aminotransferase class I/II-fold pyridoxal phosphate-dependent enzyme [Paenibacillus sp. FSL R5-0527]|uniref:DegT/DnrJ/EryC1/StrS family aminotransferase n=1 Tax=Paenibacillus sp. FSL R5-0527 TaxID=2975321 RepID=UPI00097AEA2E|nr:pyridoxal phosphate-dependent aminotransferase [Paenibacillus macerans]